MTELRYVPLPGRALVQVGGVDRRAFLQGLVSNDVAKAGLDRAIWSALLTAQGRFLHEFFLAEPHDVLLIETEADRRGDLLRRLSLYKLRSKVTLAPFDEWRVFALIGAGAATAVGLSEETGAGALVAGGFAFVDPRLSAAGLRAWLPAGADEALRELGFAPAPLAAWDALRLSLGLPDGSRDMEPEKALLLENGFDELGGVDWNKGCYMGQELTARTKYRGLVKKRLLPVAIEGAPPPPGTQVTLGGAEAGEMRSAEGGIGLALLRLEQVEKAGADGLPLVAGQARLHPTWPAWARLPAD